MVQARGLIVLKRMKSFALALAVNILCIGVAFSQVNSQATEIHWSEVDRHYLVDNLARTRDFIIEETRNLSPSQWVFKEAPDRWSINQVVEHLGIWELLFDREISMSLSAGPQPELAKIAKPDSTYLNFLLEEKVHITTDFTKPFTYTVPLGLNDGKSNVTRLVKMRDECIAYVGTTHEDLRLFFQRAGRGNIHQVCINIFGHTDRHLRQIRKIKQHKNYPKN